MSKLLTRSLGNPRPEAFREQRGKRNEKKRETEERDNEKRRGDVGIKYHGLKSNTAGGHAK